MTILNLLLDAETTQTPNKTNSGWLIWVIFGVLILVMLVPSFLRSKKEKKAYEEKMANLVVGAKVRTIGLIVGEIVSMNEQTVTLKTGNSDNYSFITVEKRAIYEVIPEEVPIPDDDVYKDSSLTESSDSAALEAETTPETETETTETTDVGETVSQTSEEN